MAFVTVSHWTATELSDDLIETATTKFIPLIMAMGTLRACFLS